MSTNHANTAAADHLIYLSKTVASKGSEFHKAIIHGIGEAGGQDAVEHLTYLSKTVASKGSEFHKAIVIALGRAGRIS